MLRGFASALFISFKISIFYFTYSDFNRIKFRKAEPSDFFETLYIYVFWRADYEYDIINFLCGGDSF